MAASVKPAGFYDDSDEDAGFMFGDEDYETVNLENAVIFTLGFLNLNAFSL